MISVYIAMLQAKTMDLRTWAQISGPELSGYLTEQVT